jgi:hypothetical protein
MTDEQILDVVEGPMMTRLFLGPRQFAKLESWCAVPNKKHHNGGMQDRRARWKEQLDKRRGHLTPRQRGGATSAEDRWLDVSAKDLLFISVCRSHPKKGGWQHDIADIFADQ